MKFCKDCVFFSDSMIDGRCSKQSGKLDLVYGYTPNLRKGWRSWCERQREDNLLFMILLNSCGKIGRWWTKKD